MPAYDFKCPEGHVTEHFMTYSRMEQSDYKTECAHVDEDGAYCTEEGEYSPSFWYNSPLQAERRIQNAQRFTPVVIHRDAQGNVRFPAHADAPLPPGFQKVELTDFHQIRKFEGEMNARDAVQAEKFKAGRSAFLDGQLKENRRVMSELVKSFTPRGRHFYEKMRAASEAKQAAGRSSANPAFYIDAFSNDSSNREGYADQRNDYGRMHGNGK